MGLFDIFKKRPLPAAPPPPSSTPTTDPIMEEVAMNESMVVSEKTTLSVAGGTIDLAKKSNLEPYAGPKVGDVIVPEIEPIEMLKEVEIDPKTYEGKPMLTDGFTPKSPERLRIEEEAEKAEMEKKRAIEEADRAREEWLKKGF